MVNDKDRITNLDFVYFMRIYAGDATGNLHDILNVIYIYDSFENWIFAIYIYTFGMCVYYTPNYDMAIHGCIIKISLDL